MTASPNSSSRPFAARGTSSRLRAFRLPAFSRTVRFRLTIWYTSLLLVFGIAFVVALNVAIRVDPPSEQVYDVLGADVQEYMPVPGPGQAVSGPRQVVTLNVAVRDVEAQINEENLNRIQNWSIVAVIALGLTSGVGGYVLSGMMLRPVRDMTRVASEISATNLSHRIDHQGPDDELKELADTFDSMIGRLETSFESQRRFVQYASHELRTPLAAIRTNIEVTEMDPEVSPEEYRDLLETVKAQTERLTRLSDDLLLLTSTESDAPSLDPVEVGDLSMEAIGQLQALADLRGISLAYDGEEECWALGQPDMLYRCVFNLIDNAIKYSEDGSSVRVRALTNGEHVTIAVQDTGPGIPLEHQGHVFDRFYRVDKGLSRKHGGSGLGLAIVRELIEAMGGSVSLQSTPGVGSTFTLRVCAAGTDEA